MLVCSHIHHWLGGRAEIVRSFQNGDDSKNFREGCVRWSHCLGSTGTGKWLAPRLLGSSPLHQHRQATLDIRTKRLVGRSITEKERKVRNKNMHLHGLKMKQKYLSFPFSLGPGLHWAVFLHVNEEWTIPHRLKDTALTLTCLWSACQDQLFLCLEEATSTDHNEKHPALDFLELVWGLFVDCRIQLLLNPITGSCLLTTRLDL